MEALKQNKILLGAFLITAILFFGYKMFGNQVLGDIYGADVSVNPVGQDIIKVLDDLQKADLDTSLFSSTIWVNLQDFSIPMPEDEAGNDQLFNPLKLPFPTKVQPKR